MSLTAAAVVSSPSALAAQTSKIVTTDDQLTSSKSGVTLAPGQHDVLTDLLVRADVKVMPGATINIASGKVLTFLGDFQAPVGIVFTGGGRVDMNKCRAEAAYPEWWGAGRDNSGVDSLPALRACIAAHPTTHLGAADYFISAPLKIDISHRKIWGAGKYWHGPNQGTRIILTNAEQDVIIIGTEKQPASPNDYVQSVDIRWMEVIRSAPPAGSVNKACGVRISYVLYCVVEGISASEHAIGFSMCGAIYTFVRECYAFRSSRGTGTAASFWGFYFDGRRDIGLAGGNASLYVTDCGVSLGGAPGLTEGIGAFFQSGYADTYLTRFETAAIATGIKIDGVNRTMVGRPAYGGHENLHIHLPIIDGYNGAGIEITNISEYALIDIVDPYLGAGAGGTAGLYMHECKGLTTVTGGQFIGTYNAEHGGNATGVTCVNVDGLTLEGTKLLGWKKPASFDRCQDFTLDMAINNPAQQASQAAISLKDCTRGSIKSRIKGQAGVFPQGVYLQGACSQLTIDCTAIDPNAIQGGVSNCFQSDGSRQLAKAGITVIGLPKG
jgi:hypothetical protein